MTSISTQEGLRRGSGSLGWGWGLAGRESAWGPGGQPDAAMTSGVAGAGEGLHPFKKGTFRLLTMRLKIVSPKENLGWGWQLEAS